MQECHCASKLSKNAHYNYKRYGCLVEQQDILVNSPLMCHLFQENYTTAVVVMKAKP